MGVLTDVVLRDLRMPLVEPYPTAIKTFVDLETLVVEVRCSSGLTGFGEAAIVEGYTHETREGGWQFCLAQARHALGRPLEEVKRALLSHRAEHSHAVSAMVSAIEMAEGHELLDPPKAAVRVPLLAPVNSKRIEAIPSEVARLLDEGFRTLKVKVGFEVDSDLERVRCIQRVVAGKAALRLDGNQGYDREQALRFVSLVSPEGIELLEQPCRDIDWDSAVAVARASPVPMMLDESIFTSDDIDRAGDLRAAAYIKLKLVKAGGIDALVSDLGRISARGMRRVLGNGVAGEIGCWMEACVARLHIDNAGELNGFLKPRDRLFANPLPFQDGSIVMPAGYRPQVDREALERFSIRTEHVVPKAR
jgi:L-alanine-DL-glutamate epimerase-like enolase superfamily enzyme